MAGRSYESLNIYYEENTLRERSPEVDYGVMWKAGLQIFPMWRVSWVRNTGEVYAYNEQTGDNEKLVVLGVVKSEEELEELIGDEWVENCGKQMGLEWLAKRLQHTLADMEEFEDVDVFDPQIVRF